MENNFDYRIENQVQTDEIVKSQREYLSKVYGWMFGGLLTTAFTSIFFMATGLQYFVLSIPFAYLLIVIAQFALVIYLTRRIETMSTQTAITAFFTYAVLTGITFSAILMAYSESLIFTTFAITSVMFGGLSLFGYVTKKDLSGVGSFMLMGLIGLIVASIINIFLGNSALDFVINIIGIIIFAGLTAYDTQKIKEMHNIQSYGHEVASKGAIIGALMLYLDFINLFLFLLRLLRR